MPKYKVWIELSKKAVENNVRILRRIKSPKTQLWAVVKSNAYGHGLFTISPLLERAGVDGFCVDSVIEGRTLRRSGIKKSILVLGPTLPHLLKDARENSVKVTISSWEALRNYVRKTKPSQRPAIHLKFDTGMHRQGFAVAETSSVIAFLMKNRVWVDGVYTHFADSSEGRQFTKLQFERFAAIRRQFTRAGFKKITFHCANTGAFLSGKRFHFDAVRIGNALYGIPPSPAFARKFKRLGLSPVLSWRSIVSEIKSIPTGETIGYGRVVRTKKPTKLAIIPIGYWHGYPWSLWKKGGVLIAGSRVPLLGRLSMDMMTADITGVRAGVNTKVTLIGTDGRQVISAQDLADILGIRPQEIITRLNPLTERIIV